MKIKTSELSGAALDWAVAVCEGEPIRLDPMGQLGPRSPRYWIWDEEEPIGRRRYLGIGGQYSPSANWALGGPIIEREGIEVLCNVTSVEARRFKDAHPDWFACLKSKRHMHWHGPTPLIAAMRCYVGSKLGDEVEIPEAL